MNLNDIFIFINRIRDAATAQSAQARYYAAIVNYQVRCKAGRAREHEFANLLADLNVRIDGKRRAIPPPAPVVAAPLVAPSASDILTVEVFYGNRRKYVQWKQLFDANVDAAAYTTRQKMGILMNKLAGEPRLLLSGLDVIDANYAVARDLLDQRYYNKDLIANDLRTQLDEVMAPRNYGQMRKFQIRVEALMTQITNLGKVLAYDETVKVLEFNDTTIRI